CRNQDRNDRSGKNRHGRIPFHDEASAKIIRKTRKRQAAPQCGLSLPFKFAEGRDDIARTIFVEQFPPRLLASPGLPCCLGEGCPPCNQAAHLAGEVLEMAALVVNCAAPVADDRAMAGNSALGRNLW